MYAVHGRILFIDLSSGKTWIERFDLRTLATWMGSRGIQAKLYWDLVSPNTDPLSPDNIVFIGSGTLTGTPMPSAGRTTITFKSPATGRYFKTSVGGDIGLKIKMNGYDIIAIKGSCEEPSIVYIENDHVEIRKAKDLWGLDVREAFAKLRNRFGFDIDALLIGPAGEKLVKYATLNASIYNVAARGGGGAVFGSKKLKGVVIGKGSSYVEVADPDRFLELALHVVHRITTDEALIATAHFGTASATMGLDKTSTLPIKNFRKSYWEHAYLNSGEHYVEAGYVVGRVGCGQCIVSCHRHSKSKTDRYGYIDTVGPEYETSNALGGNLEITDVDALLKFNDLANIYGLDTISLGAVIAWVFESYEKGYLKKLKKELKTEPIWGNVDAVLKLIDKIAKREGFGDVLAEGLEKACRKVHPETCKWALVCRGLEHSRVETRIARAYALAFALNPRGPDHLHTETFAEFGFSEGARKLIERITGRADVVGVGKSEERAKIVVWHEDMYAVTEALGFCAFITTAGFAVDEFLMSEIFRAATGINLSPEEVLRVGERIVTLERMIQVREGRTRKDDTLPWRILNEPITTRDGQIYTLTKEELDKMLDEYFRLRNWDIKTGIPKPEKLKELGLDFTIDVALKSIGR